MIDKKEEIIIDGVDVSKCCWCDFESDTEPYCRINDGEDLSCEDNSDCYYKQLKQAEQKLEKIKDYFKYYIELEPDHLKTDILKIIEGEENEK